MTKPEFKILGDSAFSHTKQLEGKILTPMKENEAPTDYITFMLESVKSNDVVRGRQAAEWGMRAVQSRFGRLQTRLTVDENKRKKIIFTCFSMYNLFTRLVGVNQIQTTYDPDWSTTYKAEERSRINRYLWDNIWEADN
jgi:hypothetical protein